MRRAALIFFGGCSTIGHRHTSADTRANIRRLSRTAVRHCLLHCRLKSTAVSATNAVEVWGVPGRPRTNGSPRRTARARFVCTSQPLCRSNVPGHVPTPPSNRPTACATDPACPPYPGGPGGRGSPDPIDGQQEGSLLRAARLTRRWNPEPVCRLAWAVTPRAPVLEESAPGRTCRVVPRHCGPNGRRTTMRSPTPNPNDAPAAHSKPCRA